MVLLFVAGIDVGSLCTKVVILDERKEIVGSTVIRSGSAFKGSSESAMEDVLKKINLELTQIACIVGTGYGRYKIPFASEQVIEITCHVVGAEFPCPNVRTVIDIGGQDSKVIRVSANGQPLDFVMNDKCAAGTGRFLEVMANALGVDMDEMSGMGIAARQSLEVSSTCTVFAESEVIFVIRARV